MADITTAMIKALREWSGAGIMDCKAALQEADGEMDRAKEILRKRRADIAEGKAHRETKNGVVWSYMHIRDDGGVPSLGVMVEVNCETDFAARAPVFKEFVNQLCLHIAVASPRFLGPDEIPAAAAEKEKALYREGVLESGKPEKIVDRIVEGKMTKWYQGVCLLEQEFALAADKSEQKPMKELLKDTIGKLGENITIRRFIRYDLGAE